MAWNLQEVLSYNQLKSLIGGQQGVNSNILKVYRTEQKVVVAQYAEEDTRVVMDHDLGEVCYRNTPFGEIFDHIEGVDDARRLIVQEFPTLSIAVLPNFLFSGNPSFESLATRYFIAKAVGIKPEFL